MPAMLDALGRIHGPDEIARCGRRARRRRHRQLQPRPDVCAARADAGRRARRPRGGDRARTRAPVALPIDARTRHGVLSSSAACCRTTTCARDAARLPARAGGARASSSTRSPPTRGPGRQCRHNLNYWRFGDYLGIGAGAHGKADRGWRGHPHRKAAFTARLPRGRRPHGGDAARRAGRRTAVRVHAECAPAVRRLHARGFRARDRACRQARSLPSFANSPARGLMAERRRRFRRRPSRDFAS